MCGLCHLWCEMAPIDLNLVRAFAAVHRTGSFSRAGEQLGVPRSTVSRAVAELEDALGTALFQRTTRRVATTAAGAALFDRLAPPLDSMAAALADLPRGETEPSGALRITATADLATVVLAEAVTRFTRRYPGTTVDVQLTPAVVDLVRDGVDLALRVAHPRLRGASLVARKVGTVTFQLYASPSYLARRGAPRDPDELAAHDGIAFRGKAALQLSAGSPQRRIAPRPRVTCDDMFFAREVLRAGGGVGALPSFLADPDVAAGRLVRVLPRWLVTSGHVYLVRPSRKHVPREVTAFSDLVLELLHQRPLSAAERDPRP